MKNNTDIVMVPCYFENLGRRDYRSVWDLQEKTLELVKDAKMEGRTGMNRLFFVEHDPVFTVGRSGKDSNMLAGAAMLQAKHAEFIHVDRGGDVTYHGPGQIVGYPVFNLEELGLGVKAYVDAHRAEMTGKSRTLNFGTVGYRISSKLVLPAAKAAEAIAALKALGRKEFVKTTETLDRAALSRQPAEFLEQIGAYIRQSDEFYYDVSGEEAEL